MTEIQSVGAWAQLPVHDVDAVVIDLSLPRRVDALEAVRSRFSGPLTVVLDPYDEETSVPFLRSIAVG